MPASRLARARRGPYPADVEDEHEARYRAYVDALTREIPGFRIVRKDRSRWQRAIHWSLVAVTFGGMRAYLTSYQTTIRRTVYVTADWDDRDARTRYITLRHEAVHLRQFRRFTLPGMALLYVLLPLPLGLAWCRARFEMAAYAEEIRATAEVIGEFLGPSYGWMWPFRRSLERWYDRVLADLDTAAR